MLWVALFATFAIALPGFLSYGNIITLIRGVAVLGILAVGMAIVVIGRGIDLSLIAVMAVSTAFAFTLMTAGYPIWLALLLGLVFAAVVGVIIGFLIAYVEIPALFATLAMGAFVYGFGRYAVFGQDLVYLPPNAIEHRNFLARAGCSAIPIPDPAVCRLCAGSRLVPALLAARPIRLCDRRQSFQRAHQRACR